MSTKHTPGPWMRGETSDSIIAAFPDDRPLDEAEQSEQEWYGGRVIAETVAPHNRPLIIAAPDLLADNTRLRDVNADLLAACEAWAEFQAHCAACNVDDDMHCPECARVTTRAVRLRDAALSKAKGCQP